MTLSVHGENGDFRVVLYIQIRLQIRQKCFSVHGVNTLQEYAFGEYAKSILPYMENTPIDIKLSLSRRIFDQNQNNFRSSIPVLYMFEYAKKPFHATVPLEYIDSFTCLDA
jgi:hypothetical protein